MPILKLSPEMMAAIEHETVRCSRVWGIIATDGKLYWIGNRLTNKFGDLPNPRIRSSSSECRAVWLAAAG
jgi:hypothetical protein